MSLLGPAQARFVSALAAETGLNPRVIGSWALAEQSGSAAKFYEGKSYNNFLNIANTDSGPAHGAHSSVWGNPISAARATAQWLRGEGQIAHEYGKPAAGIQAILHTAHTSPQEQIHAIATSGWASSGYNGGSTLTQLYGELGGQKLPAVPTEAAHAHAAAGIASEITPHLSGGPEAGPNPAQSADLVSLLQALNSQKPATATLTAPRRPQSSGGAEVDAAAPKVPQAPAEAPAANGPSAVLDLLSRIGQDATPESQASEAPGGAAPAQLGAQAPPTGSPAAGLTSRKGIVDFGGYKVAAWIAPILHYVQQHGVVPQITSGYRSRAEQTAIYNSGVRPAAVPGTSNHEGDAFPRGAVDIQNARQVAHVLESSPYKGLLVYAGPKDPVHFSHPVNGRY